MRTSKVVAPVDIGEFSALVEIVDRQNTSLRSHLKMLDALMLLTEKQGERIDTLERLAGLKQ